MHYCDTNFPTKKALKDAVKARISYVAKLSPNFAAPVTVHNPEAWLGQEAPTPLDGEVSVGGPHEPEAHTWYARVTLKAGEVVKVK